MNLKLSGLLLAIQLLSFDAFANCVDTFETTSQIKIGVLGDSQFTTQDDCGGLAYILQREFNTEMVVNAAVGGATVLGFGGSAVRNQTLPFTPDILIIGGGGNDFAKCGPNKNCLSSKINDLISQSFKGGGLHRAISKNSNDKTRVIIAYTSVVAAHAPAKWQYMVTSGLGADYAARSEAYANAHDNVEYFDFAYVLDPNDKSHWLSDGFHPSIKGYELIVKALVKD